MGLGAIYLLDYPRMRGLSVLMGLVFLGITAWVYATGDFESGALYYLILIPLSTGLALIAAGLLLNLHAMRMFYVFWFGALPAAFWAINLIGCGLGVFSKSWCA